MSKRAGFGWRWPWALPLALALWFCSPFVLQAQRQESYASEPNLLIESLRRRLLSISAYVGSLETELATWKTLSQESERQGQQQLTELAALRTELESWQTASDNSQRQVAELMRLWQESETKLKALLESSKRSNESWRLALDVAEKDLKRRKLERWLWAGAALVVGAAVGFGIAQALP